MTTFLAELRGRDVRLVINGDRLRVEAPAGLLTSAERAMLLANKRVLLALLARNEPEVAWRAEAMRRMAPDLGPLPLLVARPGTFPAGSCISCGEAVEERQGGPSYRCAHCARATCIVLDQLARHAR